MTRRIVSYLRLVALHGNRIADPPKGGPVPPTDRGRKAEAQELRDRLKALRNR